MPFKSRAQMAKCFAMKSRGEGQGWNCEQWAHETSNKKRLPYRAKSKSKSKKYSKKSKSKSKSKRTKTKAKSRSKARSRSQIDIEVENIKFN